MNGDELAGVLIPLGLFILMGFIVWIMISRRKHREDLRAEVQKQLLAKFSTGDELAAFVSQPEGREFLKALAGPEVTARQRLFGLMRTGVVLSFLGLGFIVVGLTTEERDMVIPGILSLAIGLGFLLSWFIAYRSIPPDEEGSRMDSYVRAVESDHAPMTDSLPSPACSAVDANATPGAVRRPLTEAELLQFYQRTARMLRAFFRHSGGRRKRMICGRRRFCGSPARGLRICHLGSRKLTSTVSPLRF